MHVNIIGGGVAGAAAAIALRRIRSDVCVLERRSAGTGASGSFLTLGPNALSALQALGVLDATVRAGIITDGNVVLGADGRRLGSMGLGAALRPGLTGLTVRRSTLAALLRTAAEDAGARFEDGSAARYAAGRDAAELTLDGGGVRSGDLVIGADGVNSATRVQLDPSAPGARPLGLLNFGGVTRAPAVASTLAPRSWSMIFGRRAFFGAIPAPSGDVAWFANVPITEIPAGERLPAGDTAWRGRLVDLLRADPGPAAELVADGELDLAGHDTVDLPAVPTWHDGRCILIGDAVHAPAPSSGQGAGMALEDAVVLARHLRHVRGDRLAGALDDYEAERRRRVERIVAQGRRTSSTKTSSPRVRPVQERVMSLLLGSRALELVNRRTTGWRAVPIPSSAAA